MLESIRELWDIPWLQRLIYCVCIFLAALVITSLVRGMIRRLMRKRAGQNLRADTLSKLLKSVVAYVVWFLAGIQILKVGLLIDVTSILAAAGVLGVAVGFGAQSLVKDVITGFFLLFENQFSVGESVTVDGFTGTVEELGLRSTKIRGEEGEILIIPNGAIAKVVNHSRGIPPEKQ
ncbi:MAG: mechanosensitive ion channel family protein [Oscillospiraceae bacterium]|jgi:small conductance mechanosensitive channel|nr:mechanosensitive ion channel family protein [Oscillospiraceae bacterium]